MPVKSPRNDAVDQDKLAQRFESRTHEYSSRLSLIGPLSPRGKPIGDAGARSEEPDKVKENRKTSDFLLTCQDSP